MIVLYSRCTLICKWVDRITEGIIKLSDIMRLVPTGNIVSVNLIISPVRRGFLFNSERVGYTSDKNGLKL